MTVQLETTRPAPTNGRHAVTPRTSTDDLRCAKEVRILVIDVPEDFQGVVIAQAGQRRGTITRMACSARCVL